MFSKYPLVLLYSLIVSQDLTRSCLVFSTCIDDWTLQFQYIPLSLLSIYSLTIPLVLSERSKDWRNYFDYSPSRKTSYKRSHLIAFWEIPLTFSPKDHAISHVHRFILLYKGGLRGKSNAPTVADNLSVLLFLSLCQVLHCDWNFLTTYSDTV